MDLEDFRSILDSSGVDVWTFIETAIVVASLDYGTELKRRRDEIVERLYSMSSCNPCRNCDFKVGNSERENKETKIEEESSHLNHHEHSQGKKGGFSSSPSTPRSIENDGDDDIYPYGGLFDDEQKRILDIKQHLEDPDQSQSEDSLVELLQSLAVTDITFQALKETDIGRHVNRLRKHSSNDVRRLVKQLVRKWKEIVDEWVRLNPQGEHASSGLMADGDSPQQKITQNGHHQVPDFAYSPNPHNGSSGSDKNNSEPERKSKLVPRKEASSSRATQHLVPASVSSPHNVQRQREQQKETNFDSERLASARRRLQENYKEAENAKRQRTIQVMDIHEIPKPKNAFLGKNKGGGSQGRHW